MKSLYVALFYLVDFFKEIDTTKVVALFILLLFAIVFLAYLFTETSSYIKTLGYKGAFAYGEYKVTIKDENNNVKDVLLVKAWNEINAIEKVVKKENISRNNTLVVKKTKK